MTGEQYWMILAAIAYFGWLGAVSANDRFGAYVAAVIFFVFSFVEHK